MGGEGESKNLALCEGLIMGGEGESKNLAL